MKVRKAGQQKAWGGDYWLEPFFNDERTLLFSSPLISSLSLSDLRVTIIGDGIRGYLASWSPDATQIAYYTSCTAPSGYPGEQLNLRNADGSNHRQLGDCSVKVDNVSAPPPAWSPDGAWLAYAQDDQDGDNDYGWFDIYRIRVDGSEVVRLTTDSGADTSPAWSADGEQLAFSSQRGGEPQIYVMTSDGNDLEQVTDLEDGMAFNPTWSPDGTQIAFTYFPWNDAEDSEIYSIELETREMTNLTHHPADDYAPQWSPDGESIAFLSERLVTEPDPQYIQTDIFLMDADGEGVRPLTTDSAGYLPPSWHP